MTDLILHHYEGSPYANKVRQLLSYKKLPWHSVIVPDVMPKPDLVPLTGGYRLTPVLQIGANIYCDSNLIARQLERLAPQPSLFADVDSASAHALSQWSDSFFLLLFLPAVGMGPSELLPASFVEDRRQMLPFPLEQSLAAARTPGYMGQLQAKLQYLETQLTDDRDYLLGQRPCIADFSVNVSVSCLPMFPPFAALLESLPHLHQWQQRMAAYNSAERREMSAAQALSIARAATPIIAENDFVDGSGIKPGDRLRVTPAAMGKCPVEGQLVAVDALDIAIKRHDANVGEVVVHFPREAMDIEVLA